MTIPKPGIWAGLAALVGVYVFSQAADKNAAQPSSNSHTHADGTVHEGEHSASEPGQSASPEEAAPVVAPAKLGLKPGGKADKLVRQDLKVGTGATAENGQTLSMHYRGTLTNGQQFDASYDRGQPFSFTLGAGQVIPGWDMGIKGMKVGGKRRLIIPGSLAYGSQGSPPKIPPDATLIFEVELLDVQ